MGLVSVSFLLKGLLVLQLSLLVSGRLAAFAIDSPPPTPSGHLIKPLPPTHSPLPSPHPLPLPHHLPIRKPVAVQGVVYCKSCKYAAINTLFGATPLTGAVVKLVCNNSKHNATTVVGKTDKNGYFFLQAPKKVSSYASHKCKAFLVSSSSYSCSKATNFNKGISGAYLKPEKISVPKAFSLFTVGPFAYAPTKCPRL